MASATDLAGKALAIGQYVGLSVGLILFNNWLLNDGGFPLPLCLVALHQAQSMVLAGALRLAGYVHPLLPWSAIVRLVVPIGVLFAGALSTGTVSFTYLSVAFIQMIKAWTPAVVLALSIAFGLERASPQLGLIIFITSSGVALTIYGELRFVLVGFIVMIASDFIEALRLVLVELLYRHRTERLSGLSGVYHLSPVCFICVAPIALYFEGEKLRTVMQDGTVSMWVLTLNGVIAFALNISSLVLIQRTSALTLRVVGVLKDWVVIIASTWMFNTSVYPTQWVGYAIAFVGVALYTHFKYTQSAASQHLTLVDATGPARQEVRRGAAYCCCCYDDDEAVANIIVDASSCDTREQELDPILTAPKSHADDTDR